MKLMIISVEYLNNLFFMEKRNISLIALLLIRFISTDIKLIFYIFHFENILLYRF